MFAAACRRIARAVPVAALVLWAHAAPAEEPARPPSRAPASSPIEDAFSARAGTPLRQFGYDLFDHLEEPGAQPREPVGLIGGDYRLGPGDRVTVTLRGRTNSHRVYTIDADGRLLIAELRPIPAAGRTLDEVRAELEAGIRAAHLDVEVYVAVAEIRQVAVLVVGSVARPGRKELTSHSTVLDALAAAGGVARTGSLRAIRLVRGGTERVVDLYDLLRTGHGGLSGERLEEGDRILVPPVGATVAVAGPVKRPGIYELGPGEQRVAMTALAALAGGLIRPATPRAVRLGLGPDGTETADPVTDGERPVFGDGDILMLTPRREDRQGVVRLEGHVHRPGPRPLNETRTLIDLVAERDLRPEPYRPFAVVATSDGATGARLLRAVDLDAVLDGRADRRLADGDALVVFAAADIDFLTSESVLALLRGERLGDAGTCRGLTVLARALAADPQGPLARGPQALAAARMTGSDTPCPTVFDVNPDLLLFALEHSALLRAGVPRPGFYPTAGRTRPEVLARAAGGGEALEPPRGGLAGAGDIVEPEGPRVQLLGHVRHPGVRPLTGTGTLRDVLEQGAALAVGVYPLMGVIERFDPVTLARVPLAFSPQEVAAGRADRTLMDHDRIHLFSAERVRALMAPATGDPRAPATPVAPAPKGAPASAETEPPLGIPADDPEQPADPLIAALLVEHAAQVRGAVRQPGAWPVADTADLAAVIAAAGGMTADADPHALEVTRGRGSGRRDLIDLTRRNSAAVAVRAGDSVRVAAVFARLEPRAVIIAGEVRRPGSYDVVRGERLSSLIDRAGGLTEDAYAAGIVFTRESERRRQKEQFERDAAAIERALVLLHQQGRPAGSEADQLARQLAAQLRAQEPEGRVVAEADPATLRRRPELDTLLEAGDRITVPKRPLSAAVAGEVMAPGALQFVSGKDADDYIREAGGTTRDADDGRAFVVLPDGRAEPLALSSWNHTVRVIPPGSRIVVPRDPRPYRFLETARDVGSILGQLALTAASIAVIAQ